MSTLTDLTAFDRCMDPWFKSLTLDEAKKLAEFRLDEQISDRIEVLFEKCNEGELTAREREEYDQYIQATNVIGILKAKARKLLREDAAQ